MTEKEVINLLLNRNIEITSKINNAILDILRLSYNSDRGQKVIPDLLKSIEYTLEENERIVQR